MKRVPTGFATVRTKVEPSSVDRGQSRIQTQSNSPASIPVNGGGISCSNQEADTEVLYEDQHYDDLLQGVAVSPRSNGRSGAADMSTSNTPAPGHAAASANAHRHTRHNTQTLDDSKIPLFLLKMWRIVDDATLRQVVAWDETGFSFHIHDPYTFSKSVLPQYFKHSNMNSLVRQLNMYGFRKMSALERSGLCAPQSDQDHLEFSHPYFVRGHPELLHQIKRKATIAGLHSQTGRAADLSRQSTARNLQAVLDEVKHLRERQSVMDNRLSSMIKENQTLWREVAQMRTLHVKQQHVVNKLIQFLISVVQPGNPSQKRLRRRRQMLAIEDDHAQSTSAPVSQSDLKSLRDERNKPLNTRITADRRATAMLEQLQRDFTECAQATNASVASSPSVPDNQMTITELLDDDFDNELNGLAPGSSTHQSGLTANQLIAQTDHGYRSSVTLPHAQQSAVTNNNSSSNNYRYLTRSNSRLAMQNSGTVDGQQQTVVVDQGVFDLPQQSYMQNVVNPNYHLTPTNNPQFNDQEFTDFLSGVGANLENYRDELAQSPSFDAATLNDLFKLVDEVEQNEKQSEAARKRSQQVAVYQPNQWHLNADQLTQALNNQHNNTDHTNTQNVLDDNDPIPQVSSPSEYVTLTTPIVSHNQLSSIRTPEPTKDEQPSPKRSKRISRSNSKVIH